jgi:hypothetical protein
MTPKEQKVYAGIGRRYLKTRSKKKMSNSPGAGMMMINVDEIMAEIGRLHMQNSTLNRQLQQANGQIQAQGNEVKRLGAEIEKVQTGADPARPRPALVPDGPGLSEDELAGASSKPVA